MNRFTDHQRLDRLEAAVQSLLVGFTGLCFARILLGPTHEGSIRAHEVGFGLAAVTALVIWTLKLRSPDRHAPGSRTSRQGP